MKSTLFFPIFIVYNSLHKDLKPYQFSFANNSQKVEY